MNKVVNLTGKRFGKLMVVEWAGSSKYRYATWLCQCDCGTVTKVLSGSLVSGHTRSCGCLRKRASRTRRLTHGQCGTSTYNTWINMKARCAKVGHLDYKHYGGRGITICDRWLHSFENFFTDMGPKPSSELSIDRIDNNGHYEPGNCRWATAKQQRANQRPRLTVG